ncbi:MAG: site-specific DNA-methyltransferase [Propionibacteriaceae bacterium]|nr:site-specific DNA-methyltransferase [Propionibacteriaceae bacterium]
MARSSQPKGTTPVEATVHQDKRVNIPTADAQDFMPADPAIPQVVYERDPSLDPQLVWRGKYDGDPTQLVADAPPIYIQEKIDPRVLIENLRQTSRAGQPEPELTLFDDFDGLDVLDSIDFYRHHANWSNRMILGDSLQVMASLAEREALRGQVQMVYIDPPYGIKFGSNWQVSTRNNRPRDGKPEDAVREAEQIKAFRDTWELGIHSYLAYLRDRLITARDLLTETGSCFVQIGDDNVHLVRSLMDEIFGSENFCSLISFRTTSGAGSFAGGTNVLASINDFIVWYARDATRVKYHQIFTTKGVGEAGGGQYTWIEEHNGARRKGTDDELRDQSGTFRVMRPAPFTSQTTRVGQTTVFPITVAGVVYSPSKGGWKTNQDGVARLQSARRLMGIGNTLTYVRYLDDFPAFPINNSWSDTVTSGFADPKVYVVQTNTKVIERCMLMCTDPGDLVLDPTCGSGTTAYVAEQWGRRWITIDTSRVALALARQRLMGASYPHYLLADSPEGRKQEGEVSGQRLPPTQTNGDIRQGFVYERVQHITLKSIANNPDIVEGMTRTQIDAAIKRHADFELLYDKPYIDNRRARVSGPFTVESLSPHRSLAFAAPPELPEPKTAAWDETACDDEATWSDFDQSILDNLQAAGIQNGRRKDRLELAQLEPYSGRYVQAVGTPRSEDETQPLVAIAVGPQYGTVDAQFIKEAAKEAVKIDNVAILAVLAFAFDPQAVNLAGKDDELDTSDAEFAVLGERPLGRLRLLPVRMNVDLLMGDALKKTGAGNLFTVFGEPDIEIKRTDDGQVVVNLKGVDVYDPSTGEVRSNDTDRIALWMIDSDYNGESFFIRHCYFTGGNDPYKRLKTALKADISLDAWQTLYSTVSVPFDPPATDKIAVKVINDYGDEVMQVFEVA